MSTLNKNIELEKKIKSILAFYAAGNYDEVVSRTKILLKKLFQRIYTGPHKKNFVI